MNKFLVTAATLTVLSTPAFAQGPEPQTGGVAAFIPLAVVLVIYYFYWRHKNKQAKIHEQRLVDIENRLGKLEGS